MRKVISILLSISLIITFCNSTAFAGSDNTIDAQTKSTDEINISEEELSAIIIGENINYTTFLWGQPI